MSSTKFKLYLLISVALSCSTFALAQEEIKFGAPVKASTVLDSRNMLPLSPELPAQELARSAEIILVSGYQPTKGAAGMQALVNIDRPGSKVLLVMTSYEKVNWHVTASPGTTISGILVSGYYPPTVTTTIQTQGYILKLPYAYETENVNFKKLLTQLNSLFGIDRVDVFRGSYSIPHSLSISAIDPPRVELTMSGAQPKHSSIDFIFELLATDYSKVRWTVSGPVVADEKSYIGEGKIAFSESGTGIYRLKHDKLEFSDSETGQLDSAALPANFPRFSWAMDIAYDTKRKIVSVVSLGGEGYLYRFDTRHHQWMDYRSLNNIDIFSLTYDKKADRYVAWTDQGSLIFISGEGNLMFTRKLLARMEGFGRLYDRGNGRVPRVSLVAAGDDIALVYIDGHTVRRIWYYNVKTDKVELTYARS